jgi:hypothetical protein
LLQPAGEAGLAVKVIVDANLRSGAPSTRVPVVRRLRPGLIVHPIEVIADGEEVQGNPFWYQVAPNNFLWAGTTDKPHPA